MDEKALFLSFWEKEAPATRKVLGRIPQPKCDYKPDPKSRNARELAWLIVLEELFLLDGLEKGAFDWVEKPAPETMDEILSIYDTHHDDITARMKAIPSATWETTVPFLFQGQEVMRVTGLASCWGTLFDQVHHRGQLSTYLRPMGSTVPQIYGPSADEPM
jgi:uncharacterized damage-inducible protein DinB